MICPLTHDVLHCCSELNLECLAAWQKEGRSSGVALALLYSKPSISLGLLRSPQLASRKLSYCVQAHNHTPLQAAFTKVTSFFCSLCRHLSISVSITPVPSSLGEKDFSCSSLVLLSGLTVGNILLQNPAFYCKS